MDQDLYQAPKAELVNRRDLYTPSHAWKAYCLIWIPLNIWATYDSWMNDRDREPLLYWLISIPAYAIFSLGIVGLAFRLRIGRARFWTAFLPLIVLLDIYDIFSALLPADEVITLETQVALLVLGVPLACLGWFAMRCYARFLELRANRLPAHD